MQQIEDCLYFYQQAIERAPAMSQELANIKLKRGIMFTKNGNFKKAIDDFSEALSVKSEKLQFFDLYLERGKAYRKVGEIELSIADISMCFELQKNNTKPKILASAFSELGLSFFIKGQLEEAIDRFSKAIELDPNQALYFNYRGKANTALCYFEQAEIDFNQALNLDPSSLTFLHNRGLNALASGDGEEALNDIEIALQGDPENSEFIFSKGRAYLVKKNYEQAKNLFIQSVQINKNPEVLIELGQVLYKLNLYEEALMYTNQLLELVLDDYNAIHLKALIQKSLKNYSDALISLEKAIELNPSDNILRFEQGECLLKLKRVDEAIEALTCCAELNGEDYTIYKLLGLAHRQKGEYNKSLHYFNFGLKQDPNRADFLMERSQLYTKMENYDLAEKDLTHILEKQSNSLVYYRLAVVSYLSNDFSKVVSLVNIAHEQGIPDECRLHSLYILGLSLANLEQYDKALPPLNEAILISPNETVLYHERAKCLLLVDNFDLAIDDFTKVIENQPTNSHAYFGRGFAYKNILKFKHAVR